MVVFRSKKAASNAVLQLAAGIFLTVQEEIDVIAVDGIRASAYFHAYIRERATAFVAQGQLFDHLEEAIWPIVCDSHPHLAGRFMLFVSHVVRSSKLGQSLRSAQMVDDYFRKTDIEEQWSFDGQTFAEWAIKMMDVIDDTFAQAATSWTPDV